MIFSRFCGTDGTASFFWKSFRCFVNENAEKSDLEEGVGKWLTLDFQNWKVTRRSDNPLQIDPSR